MKVQNDRNARFWEDAWITPKPLCELFAALYNICNDPHILVSDAYDRSWDLSFKRWFSNELESRWDFVKNMVTSVHLNNSEDLITWAFEKKGIFTVKSMYRWLVRGSPNISYNHI